jgi:hypothetical protein
MTGVATAAPDLDTMVAQVLGTAFAGAAFSFSGAGVVPLAGAAAGEGAGLFGRSSLTASGSAGTAGTAASAAGFSSSTAASGAGTAASGAFSVSPLVVAC